MTYGSYQVKYLFFYDKTVFVRPKARFLGDKMLVGLTSHIYKPTWTCPHKPQEVHIRKYLKQVYLYKACTKKHIFA